MSKKNTISTKNHSPPMKSKFYKSNYSTDSLMYVCIKISVTLTDSFCNYFYNNRIKNRIK